MSDTDPLMETAATFLLWGAGGHGKVVADLVRACGHRVAGFIDSDRAKLGLQVETGGARVSLSQDEFLERLQDNGRYPDGIDAVAMAIGHNRKRLHGLQLLAEYSVPPLVHPSAVVSPSANVARGSVVFPTAVLNADARIGEAVIINTGAIIEHDCAIGHGAHISPGAILAGRVTVGERSWIGAGATVIQGITIGADVVVGAGAVVIEDVPDGSCVVGIPARPLRRRDA